VGCVAREGRPLSRRAQNTWETSVPEVVYYHASHSEVLS
jgi:hypothetical protein